MAHSKATARVEVTEPVDGSPATSTKTRAFEVIRDKIREDLLKGAIVPGDKLPAEREFAESLGFSRTAVREALRGLEATGIVELQKGVKGGAFIRDSGEDYIRRSISDVIVLGKIPLGHLMEVRSLLLVRAVQLVCDHASDSDLAVIEDNINATEAEKNYAKLAKLVAEFYSLLGKFSGNEILAMLIDATTGIALEFAIEREVEFPSELLVLRRAVLARLKARDRDNADRAIRENISFLHGWVTARSAGR